jgi:hypothetical protein
MADELTNTVQSKTNNDFESGEREEVSSWPGRNMAEARGAAKTRNQKTKKTKFKFEGQEKGQHLNTTGLCELVASK